ncbi:type-2 ice-structuring protein [Lingula anatina]|uniref:Type-2 ice-structuring protein n=1 Tax=Lingula anatina TaxID=7574 RepID=A0A1S3JI98_LINAN|nr:type-2 ice-structuring protein [Lingula anatina]|eukprot:XP_013409866.1 type-2 ice-structuring protein [Lingula anatina]
MRVHLWQDSLLGWVVLWISLWYSTGSQQKAADTCSDIWVGVPKDQPKTWYKISCKAANWLMVETDCQKLGGHLAEIGSREEQTFLYDALRAVNATEFWVGYRIKAYITNDGINYVNCVVRSQTASKLWTGVLFKKKKCLAARRSTCGLIRQDSVGTVWDQACNDAHPYICETQKGAQIGQRSEYHLDVN